VECFLQKLLYKIFDSAIDNCLSEISHQIEEISQVVNTKQMTSNIGLNNSMQIRPCVSLTSLTLTSFLYGLKRQSMLAIPHIDLPT
jgi:hypothetical protein